MAYVTKGLILFFNKKKIGILCRDEAYNWFKLTEF